MNKICFKCGKEKPLSDFYKQANMADGHLGKCKECTKKDTKARDAIKRENPEWVEAERTRGREKYHRLGYVAKRPTNEQQRTWAAAYKRQYPEKVRGRNATLRMKPLVEGNHLHHWSYQPGDIRDVLELSVTVHNLLHRFLLYDQERMRYRRTDTNELLDSRAEHEAWLQQVVQSNL